MLARASFGTMEKRCSPCTARCNIRYQCCVTMYVCLAVMHACMHACMPTVSFFNANCAVDLEVPLEP